MKGGVVCKVNNRSIVTTNGCGLFELDANIFEEIVQPLNLTCEGRNDSIFYFGDRVLDRCLPFGFPQDKRLAWKKSKTSDGFPSYGHVAHSTSAEPERQKSEFAG